MLCLKWVVSIGVTFSLVSCNYNNKKENFLKNKQKKLVIGSQTDMMSIDPLSVNSLGETFIKSLLYKQVFYIQNNKFKSEYFNIRYEDKTLKVSSSKNDIVSMNDLRLAYESLTTSPLWEQTFEEILFDKDKGFVCKELKNCISKLTTLVKLLKLKKIAPFEVLQFVKGQSLLLKNRKTQNIVYFVRIKNIEDGEKLLEGKKIDLVLTSENFTANNKKQLSYFHHKNKTIRLTLYKKFNKPIDKDFYKALCESRKTIEKVFKKWRSKYNICNINRNIIFETKNKIKAVSSSKNLNKIFDVIKPKVKKLLYENKSPFELVKILKNGRYDLYLSEEIFDTNYPVLYSAFHSSGRHNSLEIKDKKLDEALDKAANSKSLKEFNTLSNKAKVRVNQIEPMLFRFEKKYVEFIVRTKQKKINLNPTLYKTLVSF